MCRSVVLSILQSSNDTLHHCTQTSYSMVQIVRSFRPFLKGEFTNFHQQLCKFVSTRGSQITRSRVSESYLTLSNDEEGARKGTKMITMSEERHFGLLFLTDPCLTLLKSSINTKKLSKSILQIKI